LWFRSVWEHVPGLWIRAYKAKKDAVHGKGGALLERLASEAAE
jgi:hypothetical protein